MPAVADEMRWNEKERMRNGEEREGCGWKETEMWVGCGGRRNKTGDTKLRGAPNRTPPFQPCAKSVKNKQKQQQTRDCLCISYSGIGGVCVGRGPSRLITIPIHELLEQTDNIANDHILEGDL